IRIWPAIAPPVPAPVSLRGHTGQVWFAVYSPDGTTLATGADDKTVRLWDVPRNFPKPRFRASGNTVILLACPPHAKPPPVACAARRYVMRPGQLKTTRQGHRLSVRSVAFSPDGKTLASGSGVWDREDPGELKLWNLETGKEKVSLSGHTALVFQVAFSPDG